jgi:hypothetical protein
MYPGATAFKHQCSSLRCSVSGGEESIDVDINHTAHGPFAFLRGQDLLGSAILDDNVEEEMEIVVKMSMTQQSR